MSSLLVINRGKFEAALNELRVYRGDVMGMAEWVGDEELQTEIEWLEKIEDMFISSLASTTASGTVQ